MKVRRQIPYISRLICLLFLICIPYVAHGEKDTIYNVLEHAENEFGKIWVFDQGDQRHLTFSEPGTNLMQASMFKDNPEQMIYDLYRLIISSVFLQPNPSKILHIGLGGGMTPKAMKSLFPNIKQDVVEINPLVKEYVKKYFNYSEDANNKIYLQDGLEYIKKVPDGAYDLIFVDAFDAEYIPEQFLTDEFAKHVYRALSNSGVAVFNIFRRDGKEKNEMELFAKYYNKSFGIDAPHSLNYIIYSMKGAVPSNEQLTAQSAFFRFKFAALNASQLSLLMQFLKNINEVE